MTTTDFEDFLGSEYEVYDMYTSPKGTYAFYKMKGAKSVPVGSGPVLYDPKEKKFTLLGSYEFYEIYEPNYIKTQVKSEDFDQSLESIISNAKPLTFFALDQVLKAMRVEGDKISISTEDDENWILRFDEPNHAADFYHIMNSHQIDVAYDGARSVFYTGEL